ncbi:MAG: ABC transporter transmembrane domain-containing protein, partial [Egibacteraceae bacterium]
MTAPTTAQRKHRIRRFIPYARLVPSLRPLMGQIRPYRGWLVAFVLVDIASHALAVLSAVAAAAAVGSAVTGEPASQVRELVWLLLALVPPTIALGVASWVTCHRASWGMQCDLRKLLYARFEELASAYLLERRSGDVGATAMGDIDGLEMFTSHILPIIPAAVLVPAGALAGLGVAHPALAVALAPFLVCYALVPDVLGRRAAAEGAALRERLGTISADVADRVQGLREVVLFGAEEQALATIARDQDGLRAAA